jgi:predicted RNA binding protein YcfA (HicA-like mRNA interferase family)
MTRLPILSAKELIQILGKLGYQEVRQRGSHIRLACPDRKPVTIPNYKTIDRLLLKKILRDAQLTTSEFEELPQR